MKNESHQGMAAVEITNKFSTCFPHIFHTFSTDKNCCKSFYRDDFGKFDRVFHIPMIARFFLQEYDNRHK